MTDTFLQHGVGLMNCATEMPAQTLNFSKPSPAEKASRGGHPTTKPVALFSRLIELFSQSGQTILDPFAGSGTTGIAARQTGRNSILIEQDEKYLKNLEVLLEE
jgi:site-specific DNA-methyltransferase (adenine-specific)